MGLHGGVQLLQCRQQGLVHCTTMQPPWMTVIQIAQQSSAAKHLCRDAQPKTQVRLAASSTALLEAPVRALQYSRGKTALPKADNTPLLPERDFQALRYKTFSG